MSEHDDWDAGRLRRVDRPHPLAADADERVRQAMLDSFDAATAAQETGGEARQLRIVEAAADEAGHEIDLRAGRVDPGGDRRPGSGRSRGRWPFLAAVAAVLLVVGVAVAVAVVSRDGSVEITEAEQAELVASFCAESANERIADIENFRAAPGGERSSRALRSVEQLSQGFADLGDTLSGELGAAVGLEGDELIQRAAEIRRLSGAGAGVDEGIRGLAADLADAIEALPGSDGCRTAALRGGP